MRYLGLLFFALNTYCSSSEKLDECKRCKVLTDSFNHWYQKTSRGKFEGGDAAWEEAKQISYARSEVRLVEVQEGLCSEIKKNKDECYALAEEAEQPIEKWWFHEDPASVDLYTWLCIDTLKQCCPDNHFGEACDPCPLDVDKVCGGRGKCDGDGTRRGKGACLCDKGYTGLLCEQCHNNFYRASPGHCESCHKACDGCSGDGANNCSKCNSGWKLQGSECMDIDECSVPGTCESNQFCTNNPGSFTCKQCDKSCSTCSGTGASNCTACADNHTLWNGNCVENKIKETLLNNALQRATLYLSFLIMAVFVSRTSKILGSFTIIIVAVYIYFSEKTNQINTANVLLNTYFR